MDKNTWHWFYLLFIATIPFPTLLQFQLSTTSVQLSDLIFSITALAWVFSGRWLKFRWTGFHTCLLLYGIAVALSTVTSIDPSTSAVKLIGKFYLIGIAFLTYDFVDSYVCLEKLAKTWLLSTAVVLLFSLTGIVLFYAGIKDPAINIVVHPIFGSLPPAHYPRIEGFFAFPAILCNFLSISWMIALLGGGLGWLRQTRLRIFGSALVTVIAFTLTPGLGGIFLATGIFLRERLKLLYPKWASFALVSGFILALSFFLIALVTVFSYTPDGTRMPLTNGEVQPSHRVLAWRSALETFLANPYLGKGVGMPTSNAQYTDPSGNRQLLADAHSTYISVLSETGLFGFLLFMGIVGFAAWSLTTWKTTSEMDKLTRLCLLAALLDAFFYQGLTGSYEDARHIWVVFGIAVGISRTIKRSEKPKFSRPKFLQQLVSTPPS